MVVPCVALKTSFNSIKLCQSNVLCVQTERFDPISKQIESNPLGRNDEWINLKNTSLGLLEHSNIRLFKLVFLDKPESKLDQNHHVKYRCVGFHVPRPGWSSNHRNISSKFLPSRRSTLAINQSNQTGLWINYHKLISTGRLRQISGEDRISYALAQPSVTIHIPQISPI